MVAARPRSPRSRTRPCRRSTRRSIPSSSLLALPSVDRPLLARLTSMHVRACGRPGRCTTRRACAVSILRTDTSALRRHVESTRSTAMLVRVFDALNAYPLAAPLRVSFCRTPFRECTQKKQNVHRSRIDSDIGIGFTWILKQFYLTRGNFELVQTCGIHV